MNTCRNWRYLWGQIYDYLDTNFSSNNEGEGSPYRTSMKNEICYFTGAFVWQILSVKLHEGGMVLLR